LVLTAAVVWVLKDLIARPRPCQLEPLVALLIAAPSNFSCPSGHATAAFSVVPILWSAKRWWGYLATGLALLMGFSRNYLFVHFPSDVLAGAVLGLSAGYLALRFIRK
ncbi:MAG: phosphatase PAP2 family protein, partial [Acidaminococcaceae bacterium]